uniref:FAD/NAD(P)-binding domain-containing protein n=1 Tax=Biomphalaria glabrata TaxID=6526 RepID=A0A2C9JKU9_BIOGL
MIHRRDKFAGENTMQQRVFANPKISIIWNSLVVEIKGTENPKIVSSIVIQDKITKTISEINAAGVFIAIGHKPSTEIFAGKIELDDHLYIKTNSCATSVPGVFAAGDVCDVKYRQAITAAGDGCKAALEVQWYLERE